MKESETYAGTWNVLGEDISYNGILHVFREPEFLLCLEITIPCISENQHPRFSIKGKFPFLEGRLLNGMPLLLYSCQTGQESYHVGAFTRQFIYAEYAFWNYTIENQESFLFASAVVDFGDILQWADLCAFQSEVTESNKTLISWESKPDIVFSLDSQTTVTFRPILQDIPTYNRKRSLNTRQSISVTFNYSPAAPWSKIVSDINEIRYLISLGMKTHVGIDRLFCLPIRKEPYEQKEILIGKGKNEQTVETSRSEYLFSLKELAENDGEHLAEWCNVYPKLKPVLDLYMSSFEGHVATAEMLFLNLTQALETFHARFFSNDVVEYRKRIQSLLDSIYGVNSNNACRAQWENLLLSRFQKKYHHILLKSRLAELFFDGGAVAMWSSEFSNIEKICYTRNYFTHYDETLIDKIYSSIELPYVNTHLMSLLSYHILSLLKFEKVKARQKLKRYTADVRTMFIINEHTNRILNVNGTASPANGVVVPSDGK